MIRTEVKFITPELAHKYLSTNTGAQRRVVDSLVGRYAQAMKQGKWRGENGESIKVDTNGNLRDGQHRLLAIIRANKAVRMMVVTGIRVADFPTLDTGQKRTNSNILQINGFKNCNLLAASSLDLMTLESGESDFVRAYERRYLQAGDILRWLKKNESVPQIVDSNATWKGKYLISPRVVATVKAALQFWCTDNDLIEHCNDFFNVVALGGGDTNSPALQLRERLIKARNSRTNAMSQTEKFAFTIAAWNLWATSDSKKLFWRSYGSAAQEFPRIHGVDTQQ